MERRGIAAIFILVIFMGVINIPVATQSDESTTQEFILDPAMGDVVYSMVLNEQNDLLLVGDRVPANSNDSFRLEGMLLEVTSQGEVSEIYVFDDNEVNSFTDIALDSSG
ncbi:MAG: hypothetical protein KAR33_14390, partial [Candidatus Thorarchaeota archaeon]|nr:hypothetical protein [Candidatus Thorarchaeota archaeon]